ncbi:MAG: hypothetical protein Q8R04_00440 [Nanoarchaeota archaeon]|nr:hypothetical protein [Nanoarchaeota archaeon]
MPTTTELTEGYIAEHISIKECLKKGIINYSALSRLISKELQIEKKTSKEAILIAAIRYRDKLKQKTISAENDILSLLKSSNIEIKNNIVIFTLEKTMYPDSLIEIEKSIKKDRCLFFSIEGTKTITLILQKNNAGLIIKKFKNNIISKKENLSLITITTSPKIGQTPGVINYLSGLFFEKGVNVDELISCYDDTLIVIDSKDVAKVMEFLKF